MCAIKKQGIIKSSLILMVSVLVGKAAGLVFKISLANMLGGTGMGYFSSAYAVFTPLYSICAASLTPAVAQLVSENEARGSLGRVKAVKSAALRLFTLPGILLSVLPMAFAGFITEKFIGNEGAKFAVVAILPCVFLGTVTAVYRGYYEGLRNMLPTALSQITESVVRVCAGIGFGYGMQRYALLEYCNKGSFWGIQCRGINELNAIALPYIAAAAVLGVTASEISSFIFMLLRHRFGRDGMDENIKPKAYEIKSEKKRLLALILPLSLAGIAASLSGTVDLYTIISCIKNSLFKHPELYAEKYADVIASGVALKELPNYLYGSFTGLAGTVFGLTPSLCSVFGKSALPNISEAWAKNDKARVSREIRRVLTVTLFISVPAGFGLSVMSKEILSLLFRSRAQEVAISWLPLSIMSLGTAFVTSGGACYAMLQAVGRPDLPIVITLAGAAVKLLLNALLVPVPQLGLVGAAIASLVSGAVMCLCSAGLLYRITGTRPKPLLSLLPPMLCGALSCGAGIYILKTSQKYLPRALAVVFSVSFAVISYIFFIILLDNSTKNRFKAEIFGK